MNPASGRLVALLRWLPALGAMAVIFVLSSQSGLRVSDDADVDRPLRALGHLSAYALLAGLLLYAAAGRGRPTLRDAAIAFVVTVLYGINDEVHQSFVPDRSGRIDDTLIDAVGALIGIGIATLILRRRRAPLSPRKS